MKIAVCGRREVSGNYVRYVEALPASALVTLDLAQVKTCDAILLPGGGDITPAFFGQFPTASHPSDTALDILQLQILEYAVSHALPVLGICKGMQLINVFFGGSLHQHLRTASAHVQKGQDQYHDTLIAPGSLLFSLCGPSAVVNSAHHQGIDRLANTLTAIQWCKSDHCMEAITHETLPILGLQWHPERLDPAFSNVCGTELLRLFLFPQ